jgi:hypothetical protein
MYYCETTRTWNTKQVVESGSERREKTKENNYVLNWIKKGAMLTSAPGVLVEETKKVNFALKIAFFIF